MLRNYLVVAVRNLLKNKILSMINVLGLGASLSICLLIILFVSYQKTSDAWHKKADRIYLTICDYRSPADPDRASSYATTPVSLASLLQDVCPDVEVTTRLRRFRGSMGFLGSQSQIKVSGLYAEPSFFEVFDFALVEGNPATALSEPNSIVLSQNQSVAFFGDSSPLNQTVMIGQTPYKVTGVLADPLGASYVRFQILVSFETLKFAPPRGIPQWSDGMNDTYTFLVLREGTHPTVLERYFTQIIQDHYPPSTDRQIERASVQLLTDLNLSVMRVNQLSWMVPGMAVYFVSVLAAIILIGACYNYTNLIVARAMARAHEVAIRKVVGAYRRQIVGQILMESILTVFLATFFAMWLLVWLIPAFNEMFFTSFFPLARIKLDVLKDLTVYLTVLGFSVGVGILAGTYPALHLSRFVPVLILKGGSFTKDRAKSFNRMFVVGQFGMSLFFVLSTLFVYQQFRYLVSSDYGFDHENIVNVRLQGVGYDVFRQAMEQSPSVELISGSSQILMRGERSPRSVTIGRGDPKTVSVSELIVDYNFVSNLKLKLFAGRYFNRPSDIRRSVLLNRTATRLLGLENEEQAIGQILNVSGKNTKPTIVGILEDFQTYDIGTDIDPVILFCEPARIHWANVRVLPGHMPEAVAHLEQVWAELGSPWKVEYDLFTTQIQKGMLARIYSDVLHIIALISAFGVLLALLGVLGIAMHVMEMQVKAVAIRKVLGASSWQIAVLLSKDFLLMLVVAVLLAAPAAWFANHLWLNQFPLRTTMSPWLFGGVVAVMVAVVLTVVGSQTLRAANSDPVKALRRL